MLAPLDGLFSSFEQLLVDAILVGALSTLGGIAVAIGLRLRDLRWTWSAAPAPAVVLSTWWWPTAALVGVGVCAVGCLVGMAWQSSDLMAGADRAEVALARIGVFEAVQRAVDRWQAARQGRGWVHNGHLEVGRDERGRPASISVGGCSGSHTLILGATGSGKTCTEAWIAGRLIERGHGAIAIDPKGDELLRAELARAAERRGVPFRCWSPQGPLAYNPYAYGSDTEIADKALAGETFTEPHYLRQAQRYLGHAVRTMRAAELPVTAASLMAHMEPLRLEATARGLPPERADAAQDYLDSLGERQRRELAGVRDRLSILAESDVAPWLDGRRGEPGGSGGSGAGDGSARDGSDGRCGHEGAISLREAVEERAVVYFALDADRRPLLAEMLAASIVADLVTLAAHLQHDPIPTLVLIDEFSAVGAERVERLFGRGRSAGMSLLLSTQELADLRSSGEGALRDQAIGGVECLIAHRQTVPESAELIAAVAGTKPTWITTQHTKRLLGRRFSGRGSRQRDHRPAIHPSRIMRLRTGEALVITPANGRPPAIAQMHHPSDAH